MHRFLFPLVPTDLGMYGSNTIGLMSIYFHFEPTGKELECIYLFYFIILFIIYLFIFIHKSSTLQHFLHKHAL